MSLYLHPYFAYVNIECYGGFVRYPDSPKPSLRDNRIGPTQSSFVGSYNWASTGVNLSSVFANNKIENTM